jgi:hypothetical protein
LPPRRSRPRPSFRGRRRKKKKRRRKRRRKPPEKKILPRNEAVVNVCAQTGARGRVGEIHICAELQELNVRHEPHCWTSSLSKRCRGGKSKGLEDGSGSRDTEKMKRG